MIWFDYKYLTFSEIVNSITLITQYSYTQYAIFVFVILFVMSSIFFIIPSFNIYSAYRKKEKEKEKKKEFIKQIAMQKDINDEIEKELHIH